MKPVRYFSKYESYFQDHTHIYNKQVPYKEMHCRNSYCFTAISTNERRGDKWKSMHFIRFPQYKEKIKNVYEEYRKTICDNSIEGHKIECCNDLNFLNDYIDLCKKIHIDINVILCESLISEPKLKKELKVDKKTCQFLGYDYAYKGGSFYSGVLNDLCFERMIEMKDITLNQFGLCASMDELNSYIQKRSKLKLIMPQYTFEDGDFTVYKLWKWDFNSIL